MAWLLVVSAHIWVIKQQQGGEEERHKGGNAEAPSVLQTGRAKAPGPGERTHPPLQLPPCRRASQAEPRGAGGRGHWGGHDGRK